MKNFLLKNIRSKAIALAVCTALYAVLIILSLLTPLGKLYLFEWTVRNLYWYNWAIALILIAFDKLPIALAAAAGNFTGVFLGEFLGGYIEEYKASQIPLDTPSEKVQEMLSANYQWGIWIETILLFTAAAVIYTVIVKFKRKTKPQPLPQQ